MRTLDLSRPYATVSPPYQIPGADRAQCFDQDGRAFDAHGQEIVLGDTPQSPGAPQNRGGTTAPQQATAHIDKLIANATKMSQAILTREARLVLGDSCPSKPEKIVEALRAKRTVQLAAGIGEVCAACGRPFAQQPESKTAA